MRAVRLGSLLALASLSAACGNSAVATVRIQLNADGSGQVTTSSLLTTDERAPLEQASTGVQWDRRVQLACAHGTFAAAGGLELADLQLQSGTTPAGFHYLELVLPGGADAQWPAMMTPAAGDRDAARQTFDPRRDLGAPDLVAFEVDVPGRVASSAVTPKPRGAETDHTERRATLELSVDRVRERDGPFRWLVTWRDQ